MREWRTEVLERIAEIRSSNVDKKSNPGEKSIHLCNYMDVYLREYITEAIEFMEATATPAEIQRFGIQRGDVMITKDSETPDDIGIPVVVVDDIPNLVCGYHVALIRPNRAEVDPVYLAKQLGLSDTARYYGRLANGSTRYGLSYQSIARTPIRLAPLPQQQRIAEILSTVDEAIEQTEALIAKTQQIKAGLMHDLLTRGVTADGQLRPPRKEAPQLYKESPLGWIPKEWGIRELGGLGAFMNGLNKPKDQFGFGMKFINISDVYPECLNLDNLGLMNATAAECRRYGVKSGDILIDRSSVKLDGVGYPTVFPASLETVVFCGFIIRFRIVDALLRPTFAVQVMRSPAFRRLVIQIATASANVNVNQQALKRLPMLIPDMEEQLAIEERANATNLALESELEAVRKLKGSKNGLMQDLLTGRVPVNSISETSHAENAANG